MRHEGHRYIVSADLRRRYGDGGDQVRGRRARRLLAVTYSRRRNVVVLVRQNVVISEVKLARLRVCSRFSVNLGVGLFEASVANQGQARTRAAR